MTNRATNATDTFRAAAKPFRRLNFNNHELTEKDNMAPRQASRTITKVPELEEPPVRPGQGKRPDIGQFRLQVDRQTKASFKTYEEAELAGLAIKRGHPIVRVAVYDVDASINKIIELPNA